MALIALGVEGIYDVLEKYAQGQAVKLDELRDDQRVSLHRICTIVPHATMQLLLSPIKEFVHAVTNIPVEHVTSETLPDDLGGTLVDLARSLSETNTLRTVRDPNILSRIQPVSATIVVADLTKLGKSTRVLG